MSRRCVAGASAGAVVGEKWLCRLWRRQRWTGAALATCAGQPLQVVYPGRHTFDHGPDFRDALLVFGDELVHGDVEVHVRTGDWRSHGHQADPHYDRVVLHAVWRDDGLPALTSAGWPVPALALEQYVAEPPDGDNGAGGVADPAEELVAQRMPCSLDRGARALLASLTTLGEQRLADKAALFEAALAVEEPAEVLYAALLEMLGYAANRAPCRELARNVPWRVVAAAACGQPLPDRIATLEALFFGCAGLLPAQRDVPRPLGPEDAAHAAVLAGRWSPLHALWRIAPLSRQAWRFARVRPENFPPRRLAAAARLFAPYVAADLPAAFLGVLRSEEPADIPAALESALAVPAEGYWATHCDFGSRSAAPAQLLGRGRAADGAVNVILPFAIAYGEARGDVDLAARARAAYRCYPALAENEITRYMARLTFGRARPRGVTAAPQQGLLHAYHHYCREKRCADCPLAASAFGDQPGASL